MADYKETGQQNKTESTQEAKPRIPVYADMSVPKMHDPARPQPSTVWRGSNRISFKLLRCVEAIRDLTKIFENMSVLSDPLSDKRLAKMTATPLYSLALGVEDMFNELEGNAKEYSIISSAQRKELKQQATQFAKLVPTDRSSELKEVRDKMSSHIDRDTVETPEPYWGKVDLLLYLGWLKICLEQIMHMLTLDVYGWTRDSGNPDVWSLMRIDGTIVDFYMHNGEPVSILSVTIAKSPKYGIADEIQRLAELYNEIAAKCRVGNNLSDSGETA